MGKEHSVINFNLEKTAAYIIFFVPLLIITGPFLSDSFSVILSLLYIFFIIKKKNINFQLASNPFILLFIAFWIISVISSLMSEQKIISLNSSFLYLRFVILIFAIDFFLKLTDEKNLKTFFYFLLFIFLSLFFDSLYQLIVGKNLLGFPIDNQDKINSFFGDEAVMGSYIIRLLPLVIALYFHFNMDINKKNDFLFSVFLVLMFFLILISGSRSSLFLSGLLILILFISTKRFRNYLIYLFVFLSLILAILFLTNKKFNYKIYISVFDPIKTIFNTIPVPDKFMLKDNIDLNKLKNKKAIEGEFTFFTHVHQSHYKTAHKMFMDKKILGHGPKSFRYSCSNKKFMFDNFSCSTHPHNFYLQFLAETGFVGFLIMFFIFAMISIILFKKLIIFNIKKNQQDFIKNQLPKFFIIVSIFINLWPFIPSGNFYNNWLSVLMIFPIGFYYRLGK